MLNLKIVNVFLEEVDSTQTFAKKNYSSFDPSLITCISSEKQTDGIGRFHRKWISFDNQSINATFYFSLPANTKDLTSLGQILTLGVIELLKKEKLEAKIRWPNDILINEKKLAGILCETILEEDIFHIFLGIGINVNVEKSSLSLIDQPATSLKAETEKEWDKSFFLQKLQKEFLSNMAQFLKTGFLSFHSSFDALLLYKNETMTFFDGHARYDGMILSTTPSGALLFKIKTGEIKTFQAGDLLKKKD